MILRFLILLYIAQIQDGSSLPTSQPTTTEPTPLPSSAPSSLPSQIPFPSPSLVPSISPSISLKPTSHPSPLPNPIPTQVPSFVPSVTPSPIPTNFPSKYPSPLPTPFPTQVPSFIPSLSPSPIPSFLPSKFPISSPTLIPSNIPTDFPSIQPTSTPTQIPSEVRDLVILNPINNEVWPLNMDFTIEWLCPTTVGGCSNLAVDIYLYSNNGATYVEKIADTVKNGTYLWTVSSSLSPRSDYSIRFLVYPGIDVFSDVFMIDYTFRPTFLPSPLPTSIPSPLPTILPIPSPSPLPTSIPSKEPTMIPTLSPSALPSSIPSLLPFPLPTSVPTSLPSMYPTHSPTNQPTLLPSLLPTSMPIPIPTSIPIPLPTFQPSLYPTPLPTESGILLLQPQKDSILISTSFYNITWKFSGTYVDSSTSVVTVKLYRQSVSSSIEDIAFLVSAPKGYYTWYIRESYEIADDYYLTITDFQYGNTAESGVFSIIIEPPTPSPTLLPFPLPSSQPTLQPTSLPTSLPTPYPTGDDLVIIEIHDILFSFDDKINAKLLKTSDISYAVAKSLSFYDESNVRDILIQNLTDVDTSTSSTSTLGHAKISKAKEMTTNSNPSDKHFKTTKNPIKNNNENDENNNKNNNMNNNKRQLVSSSVLRNSLSVSFNLFIDLSKTNYTTTSELSLSTQTEFLLSISDGTLALITASSCTCTCNMINMTSSSSLDLIGQYPTLIPTPIPTIIPTYIPTFSPIPIPTPLPTQIPTYIPTLFPIPIPTPIPTQLPTPIPTISLIPTTLPSTTHQPTLCPYCNDDNQNDIINDDDDLNITNSNNNNNDDDNDLIAGASFTYVIILIAILFIIVFSCCGYWIHKKNIKIISFLKKKCVCFQSSSSRPSGSSLHHLSNDHQGIRGRGFRQHNQGMSTHGSGHSLPVVEDFIGISLNDIKSRYKDDMDDEFGFTSPPKIIGVSSSYLEDHSSRTAGATGSGSGSGGGKGGDGDKGGKGSGKGGKGGGKGGKGDGKGGGKGGKGDGKGGRKGGKGDGTGGGKGGKGDDTGGMSTQNSGKGVGGSSVNSQPQQETSTDFFAPNQNQLQQEPSTDFFAPTADHNQSLNSSRPTTSFPVNVENASPNNGFDVFNPETTTLKSDKSQQGCDQNHHHNENEMTDPYLSNHSSGHLSTNTTSNTTSNSTSLPSIHVMTDSKSPVKTNSSSGGGGAPRTPNRSLSRYRTEDDNSPPSIPSSSMSKQSPMLTPISKSSKTTTSDADNWLFSGTEDGGGGVFEDIEKGNHHIQEIHHQNHNIVVSSVSPSMIDSSQHIHKVQATVIVSPSNVERGVN